MRRIVLVGLAFAAIAGCSGSEGPDRAAVNATDAPVSAQVQAPAADATARGEARLDQGARDPRSYIGLRHGRELPDGLHDEGGSVLGGNPEAEFSVGLVRSTDGTRMAWLERIVALAEGGQPTFEVVDVLSLPEIGSGEGLLSVECAHQEDPDAVVIAIGTAPLDGPAANPRVAWRVDPPPASFSSLSPQLVECASLGD